MLQGKRFNLLHNIAKIPTINNIIGIGLDIAKSIFPSFLPDDKLTKAFETLHHIADIANRIVVPPSSNAAYGLGTLGPKEPAPAFIGDRQELIEDHEIIQHNPGRKTKSKKKNKSKKTTIVKPSKKKMTGRKYKLII